MSSTGRVGCQAATAAAGAKVAAVKTKAAVNNRLSIDFAVDFMNLSLPDGWFLLFKVFCRGGLTEPLGL